MNRLTSLRTVLTLALGLAAVTSLAATPFNSRTARERQTIETAQPKPAEAPKAAGPSQEQATEKATEQAPKKTASWQLRGHQA